jgi:hypothetical protein
MYKDNRSNNRVRKHKLNSSKLSSSNRDHQRQ